MSNGETSGVVNRMKTLGVVGAIRSRIPIVMQCFRFKLGVTGEHRSHNRETVRTVLAPKQSHHPYLSPAGQARMTLVQVHKAIKFKKLAFSSLLRDPDSLVLPPIQLKHLIKNKTDGLNIIVSFLDLIDYSDH